MLLSFETLTSVMRIGLPTLVELIDLDSAMLFLPLRNPEHVVILPFTDFPSHSKRYALFHRIAYGYSCADCDCLHDHLRDVPWEDIFKLVASAAASEFCEWIQVGVDVYIPHRKDQVKPLSCPWFLAACAAALVHKSFLPNG